MNMRTRVECVITPDFRDVNSKIEEMEEKGWYLRGTLQFLFVEKDGEGTKLVAYMTFEKENSPVDSRFN